MNKKIVIIIVIVMAVMIIQTKKEGFVDEFGNHKADYLSGGEMGTFIGFANAWVESTESTYSYTTPDGFTYTADYPIIYATELIDYTSFNSKCILGECNMKLDRYAVCILPDNSITYEEFECFNNTVPNTIAAHSLWCDNGQVKIVGYPGTTELTCSNIQTINFYYLWNNWEDVGYDPTWQSRWEPYLFYLNVKLAPYGLQMEGNYIEYQLPDDSNHPALLVREIDEEHPAYQVGDINVIIGAGDKSPAQMGMTCPTSPNICKASGGWGNMNFPDWINSYQTESVFVHEFGHTVGCGHLGWEGSFAPLIYAQGYMGYGSSMGKFYWECRPILWLLGENQ